MEYPNGLVFRKSIWLEIEIVQVMSVIEMTNWKTKSENLNEAPFLPFVFSPFIAETGVKDDRRRAG